MKLFERKYVKDIKEMSFLRSSMMWMSTFFICMTAIFALIGFYGEAILFGVITLVIDGETNYWRRAIRDYHIANEVKL